MDIMYNCIPGLVLARPCKKTRAAQLLLSKFENRFGSACTKLRYIQLSFFFCMFFFSFSFLFVCLSVCLHTSIHYYVVTCCCCCCCCLPVPGGTYSTSARSDVKRNNCAFSTSCTVQLSFERLFAGTFLLFISFLFYKPRAPLHCTFV